MKFFVDTNILIDCMENREPFSLGAQKLLMLGALGEADLWMSPSQITDAFYLLSDGGKKSLTDATAQRLKKVRGAVRICSLGEYDIDAALDASWDDFEDACLYQCAQKIRADVIVTRNQKDFARSRIPVMDCDELFAWLEQERSLVYDFIDL